LLHIHRLGRSAPVRLTLLAITAALLVLSLQAQAARAADADVPQSTNPNNLGCHGTLAKGTPVPGDEDAQVEYRFGCTGPITGFSIQPQIGNSGFGDGALVFDYTGLNAVSTDSFTCAGTLPGFGFNCVGQSLKPWQVIVGQFGIATKLCAEPRVDALLTVVSVTVDSKTAKATTGISGPFDLGRPQGCPKSKNDKALRIPKSGIPGWYPTGQVKAAAKAKKKAAAKKKTVKKKA